LLAFTADITLSAEGCRVAGAGPFAPDRRRNQTMLLPRNRKLLASFARSKKTRVTCVFDGPEPASFATHLGPVSIVFSAPRTADDVIFERASHGHGWSVVTSDRGLAARVERRHVKVVAPAVLIREMELASSSEPETGSDWDDWFSDEKNRLKF
jgi:hypothetical protein